MSSDGFGPSALPAERKMPALPAQEPRCVARVSLRSHKSYCAVKTGVEKSVGTVLVQCVGDACIVGALGKLVSMMHRVSGESASRCSVSPATKATLRIPTVSRAERSLYRLRRVSILQVAWEAARPEHEPLQAHDCNADFDAEFVGVARLCR